MDGVRAQNGQFTTKSELQKRAGFGQFRSLAAGCHELPNLRLDSPVAGDRTLGTRNRNQSKELGTT